MSLSTVIEERAYTLPLYFRTDTLPLPLYTCVCHYNELLPGRYLTVTSLHLSLTLPFAVTLPLPYRYLSPPEFAITIYCYLTGTSPLP